jgi:hypothetical protein
MGSEVSNPLYLVQGARLSVGDPYPSTAAASTTRNCAFSRPP